MATAAVLDPALQGLPALDLQKMQDRAALKAAIAPPLAAVADIGSLPTRVTAGAVNLLTRGVNTLLPQGINIPGIPNGSGLTPYFDALRASASGSGAEGTWAAPAPTTPAATAAVTAVAPPAVLPVVPEAAAAMPNTAPAPLVPAAPTAAPAAPAGTPWSITKTLRNEDGSAGQVTNFSGMTAAPATAAAPVRAPGALPDAYALRMQGLQDAISLAQQMAPGNVTAQRHILASLVGGFNPGSDAAHVLGAQIGVAGNIATAGISGQTSRDVAGINAEAQQALQGMHTQPTGQETEYIPGTGIPAGTRTTYGFVEKTPAGMVVTPVGPQADRKAAKPVEGSTGTLKDGRRFVIKNGEPVVTK